MKDLFTIGEIASLFSVNIRTLRYYDEYGVLRPERTDPQTGYRYYSTRQFERLNTIKYLRALDMPLAGIARFFESRDTDVLRELLQEQKKETQTRIGELLKIEKKLERRLAQLDEAEFGEQNIIRQVFLPRRRIAVLKKEIRPEDDLEYPIRELERESGMGPMIFLGKVGLSVNRENLLRGQFDQYDGIFVFVEREEEEAFYGKDAFLPAGEYAAVRYSGTHKHAAGHYEKLMEYINGRGLTCAGNSVEVTLIDAGFTDEESKYVTELQVPVRTAAAAGCADWRKN